MEGLEAMRNILNTWKNPEISMDDVDLAELVIENNNFEVNGRHFLQKHGTAIGTKLVLVYAYVDLATVKLYLWLWHIGCIFDMDSRRRTTSRFPSVD